MMVEQRISKSDILSLSVAEILSLRELWIPAPGDVVAFINNDNIGLISSVCKSYDTFSIVVDGAFNIDYKSQTLPLLSTGQILQMLKDRDNAKRFELNCAIDELFWHAWRELKRCLKDLSKGG